MAEAAKAALAEEKASGVTDADKMNEEQLLAHGVNDSLTHVDFMIGGDRVDVFGQQADGTQVPLMEQGEWAQAMDE